MRERETRFAVLGGAASLAAAGAPAPVQAQAHCSAVDTSNVRVMVVYTEGARQWAESQQTSCTHLLEDEAITSYLENVRDLTNIEHVCDSELADDLDQCNAPSGHCAIQRLAKIAVAETNRVFADSGITNVNVELADTYYAEGYVEGKQGEICHHAEPFLRNISESLGIPGELARLRNKEDADSPGHIPLNAVHQRRLQVEADLVVMLTGETLDDHDVIETPVGALASPIAGLASGIAVRDPKNGFAALVVDKAVAPYFAFAHEVSHLFGANHTDVRSLPVIGPMDVIASQPYYIDGSIDAWAFNDSAAATSYATIMDTGCAECLHLPLLSTTHPASHLSAIPYGVEGVRDNARTVCEHAPTLAQFAETLAAQPAEPQGVIRYGVDFGYREATGYDIDESSFLLLPFDYRTHDEDCDLQTGAGCDRYWNNLTDRSADGPVLDLLSETGVSEGITLDVTRSFHGYAKTDNFMGVFLSYGVDEMPTMAMADGMTSVRLYTTPRFVLSGLDTQAAYAFKFFASRSPADSRRVVKLELRGAQTVTTDVESHGNILRFADAAGVQPKSDGTIEVLVIADMASVPFFTSVSLNAMEFYKEP